MASQFRHSLAQVQHKEGLKLHVCTSKAEGGRGHLTGRPVHQGLAVWRCRGAAHRKNTTPGLSECPRGLIY